MKPNTAEAFRRLEQIEWLQAVGKGNLPGVKRAQSWIDAIALSVGRHWQNVQLEGLNLVGDKVQAASIDRYQDWNKITAEVRPIVKELVQRKTAAVMEANKLPAAFVNSVVFDILGLGLECEYEDVKAAGFFTGLANYYLAGHFPCGWEGDFPEGRLIVY